MTLFRCFELEKLNDAFWCFQLEKLTDAFLVLLIGEAETRFSGAFNWRS